MKKNIALKSKSTKTFCISKEGTFFRIINAITNTPGKPYFIKTCQDYEREDIDSNMILHHDHYSSLFTLLRFRRDVMGVAVDRFPEEFILKLNALDPKCKLFFQKGWNCLCWIEIANTG